LRIWLYVFAIVGVSGLDAAAVGHIIPAADLRPVALLRESKRVIRKRDYEDWMSIKSSEKSRQRSQLATSRFGERIGMFCRQAREGSLVGKTIERVHAVSVRGFTRNFPTAEVDMHFSLSGDMVELSEFLVDLRTHGDATVMYRLTTGIWYIKRFFNQQIRALEAVPPESSNQPMTSPAEPIIHVQRF